MVSLTANWALSADDEFVGTISRHLIEQIDAFAATNHTGHPFRYLNYCADWQRPFEGYGMENWNFLRDVSRKYDPEGFFQRGCISGFKLGVGEGEI